MAAFRKLPFRIDRRMFVGGVLLLALVFAWFQAVRIRQEQRDARLVSAVEARDDASVSAMLSAGADPNARVYGSSLTGRQWLARAAQGEFQTHPTWHPLLLSAVFQGDERIVEDLLAHGANVNARDPDGLSVLPMGTHPSLSMVRLLLRHGLNCYGQDQALWVAVTHRDFPLTRLLIAQGADVDAQDWRTGITTLQIASLGRRHAMVKFLLAHGANPNLRDSLGKTALQDVMTYGPPDAMLLHLLERASAK